MSNKILVTDSLFIFDEHVKQLEDASYEVERLDTPKATEEQLIEAVKGKVGYVLGGIEQITDKVIDSADSLKAIIFTGADYQHFIPGYQTAREKGIAIANSPGSNAHAVSEFAVATALAMERNLFELGRTGDKTFQTTGSFKDATIGVIGAGNVGNRIIEIVSAFQPAKVQYYKRTQNNTIKADFVDLDTLLTTSDIIFVAIPAVAGQLLTADNISKTKNGALVVNIGSLDIFDLDALLERLQADTLRAAVDYPAPSEAFTKLPLHTWFNTNDHTAYNTHQANRLASDRAVKSIINLLTTGNDEFKVM